MTPHLKVRDVGAFEQVQLSWGQKKGVSILPEAAKKISGAKRVACRVRRISLNVSRAGKLPAIALCSQKCWSNMKKASKLPLMKSLQKKRPSTPLAHNGIGFREVKD